MSKGPTTDQEEIVAELSAHIVGRAAVFIPELYGKYGREPADIACVTGRCAILIYLTEGKKSFNKKLYHNAGQLRTWLRKWPSSNVLQGNSQNCEVCYSWEDIDYVIGLFVSDGAEAGCEFHDDEVLRELDRKLVACATVTKATILEMARLGAGPLDILRWIVNLRKYEPRRVSEGVYLADLWKGAVERTSDLRDAIGIEAYDREFLNEAWLAAQGIVKDLRTSCREKTNEELMIFDIISDDVIWLGLSYSIGISLLAQPGEIGILSIIRNYRRDSMWIKHAVVANVQSMRQVVEQEVNPLPNVLLINCVQFGSDNPMTIVALNADGRESQLATYAESLRATFKQMALERQKP